MSKDFITYGDKCMTPEFRLSFPNLFKKGTYKNEETNYNLSALFAEGADLSKLKDAIKKVAKERWGDAVPKGMDSPFQDQGDKDYEGYEEGCIFIKPTSNNRPGIVDKNRNPIVDEEDIYPGCYCRATVVAAAYGGNGEKPGIKFYLQNVQMLRDGDRLGGGRSSPEDDFEAVDTDDDVGGDDLDDMFE